MKYCSLLSVVLSLLLSSCTRTEPPKLEGLWLFHENSHLTGIEPDCFLNLKKNGRYTLFIPDYYDYGYWKKGENDTSLILFTSKRHPRYYDNFFSIKVKKYDKDKLEIVYTLPAHVLKAPAEAGAAFDKIKSPLDKEAILLRSEVQYPDSLDPYSYGLNRWRMLPDSPESCKEISDRTVNYLRHMYALFQGQYLQQTERYGYPHSPSPLLYGQNGIATINFDVIPEYWKRTFYNESQAKQSCAILYALFDEKLVIPKEYKRPDELWAKLLKQMADYAQRRDYCSGEHMPDTAVVK